MLFKRNFAPLFVVQFFGAMNDNILKNALLIMITFGIISSDSPATLVNAAAGVFILPFFLFSAWAGIIAEKHDKTKLTRMLKLVELAIAIVSCVGLYTHNIWILLAALFGLGSQAAFFGPIKYAIIPQHLPPQQLVKGNAYIEGGTFLAILLGTIIGGTTITGANGSFIVSALLVSVALIGYAASRFMPPAPASNPTLPFEPNIIKATSQVLKEGTKSRVLMLSMLGISWFWFLGALILTQLPLYVKEYLHGDEGMITAFLAIFSIGIGIGSVVCEKLSHKQVEIGLVPIGSLGITLFLADLIFFAGGVTRAAIDFFGISFFSGFFTVPLYSLLQERSDKESRSRTIAANNILNAIFMVVASLLAVLLFKLGADLSGLFLMLLALHIIVALYVYSEATEFLWRFAFWAMTLGVNAKAADSNITVVEYGIKNIMEATKHYRHDIQYIVARRNLTPFWNFVFTKMGAHIYDEKPAVAIRGDRNYISDTAIQ